MPTALSGSGHVTEDLSCSFCGKDQLAVGKLIASAREPRRIYICDECIAVCSQVSEQKEDPIVGNPLLSEFLEAAEQWFSAEARNLDASQHLSRMREIARLMFARRS